MTDTRAESATASTASALSLRAVRIRHDERARWTPASVTLDIEPGEVVLLLGPSGSGKSTLALAANGLIPHVVPAELEGSITTGGLDAADTTVAELSRHVGMVFQDPDSQVVTGTVLDEVCFGAENLLVPADEVMRRAERALVQVGLWHRRFDNPDRLSGGGRQRLAIACALALESPLLVLDEPTANLDPAGIAEVYSVLRSIVRRDEGPRPAVLLIEHNLDAAIDLVDRVAVIDREGHLVLEGHAHETLRANAEALHELGVWLPVATLAALRLRGAGVALEPLPLTPDELAAALEARATLPAVGPGSAAPAAAAPAAAAAAHPARDVTFGRSKGGASTKSDVSRDMSSHAAGAGAASAGAGGAGGGIHSLITVRGLTVERGGRNVVRDVNLDVRAGDFLAVVGTNGAGKTTLVQSIAGVLRPPAGAVRVGDIDPARADAAARARQIGFVFQNPEHQFVTATVFDELAHGLRMQRKRRSGEHVSDDEIAERVDDVLHRFGLTELRDVHPFLLSGGQKRRLSVGTALIVGPPVIALDEPTFGQDRERAAALLDLLTGLRDAGTTVIVVTHDLQLVADYASHVAVMGDGELLEHARTEDVLGNARLLQRAGLRLPPLAAAMRRVERHPEWRRITRVADLPGAPVRPVPGGPDATGGPDTTGGPNNNRDGGVAS